MSTPAEAGSELATEPRRIVQLLKSLIQTKAKLTVLLPAGSATHTSSMIEVDADRRLIKIDEFVPAINPSVFNEDDRLSIHGKVNGIPIHFETRFEHIGRRNDFEFFVCEFPEEVVYDQKRKSYRLTGIYSDVPTVSFRLEDKKIKAPVRDISTGGAKIHLRTKTPLSTGDVIPDMRIEFADGSSYTTASEVRSHQSRANTMGIMFLSLNDFELRELQNWIMNTERKNLRRRVYLLDGSSAMT